MLNNCLQFGTRVGYTIPTVFQAFFYSARAYFTRGAMTHSNTLGIAAGAVDIRSFHNGDIVLLGPLFRLRLPQFIIVFNGGNICAAIRTDKPAISYMFFN
jgi:hypothetical protein